MTGASTICPSSTKTPSPELAASISAGIWAGIDLVLALVCVIRMFQREFKTTPAKYVEDVRVEAACRQIELGRRSMEEIARRCGYHSVDVLRKAFVRRMGVSPKEYAQRFAPVKESA